MTSTDLYRDHLATLGRTLSGSLELAAARGQAFDAVVFHSGRHSYYHRDDELVPFRADPHFRRWVPILGPDFLVLARPGRPPKVGVVRPPDYWYDSSPLPDSYWQSAVDIVEAGSFGELVAAIGELPNTAFVGGSRDAAHELGIDDAAVEPTALMAPLDWHRAHKTDYEIALFERSAEKCAGGHRHAREAFEAGASEQQVHWSYLRGSEQLEWEIPYVPIIAFDQKSAILHYQEKRGIEAAPGQILLLDAGAGHLGMAADVTRTWARPGTDETFVALIEGLDEIEQNLVSRAEVGRTFLDLHIEAHRAIGDLLAATGIVTSTGDEALERGVTSSFFPHGLGHHLGFQVHDVGGRQAGPEGGEIPPPTEHAYLRNTRIIEAGHLVTIEPGLYFIPMLLEPLRASAEGAIVDWSVVERLTPLGGIRIEDNVLATAQGPRDLTRQLIEGPRGR